MKTSPQRCETRGVRGVRRRRCRQGSWLRRSRAPCQASASASTPVKWAHAPGTRLLGCTCSVWAGSCYSFRIICTLTKAPKGHPHGPWSPAGPTHTGPWLCPLRVSLGSRCPHLSSLAGRPARCSAGSLPSPLRPRSRGRGRPTCSGLTQVPARPSEGLACLLPCEPDYCLCTAQPLCRWGTRQLLPALPEASQPPPSPSRLCCLPLWASDLAPHQIPALAQELPPFGLTLLGIGGAPIFTNPFMYFFFFLPFLGRLHSQ